MRSWAGVGVVVEAPDVVPDEGARWAQAVHKPVSASSKRDLIIAGFLHVECDKPTFQSGGSRCRCVGGQ